MNSDIDQEQMEEDFDAMPDPRGDGAMRRARQIVEAHIEAYGMVPYPDRIKEAIAAELALVQLAAVRRPYVNDHMIRAGRRAIEQHGTGAVREVFEAMLEEATIDRVSPAPERKADRDFIADVNNSIWGSKGYFLHPDTVMQIEELKRRANVSFTERSRLAASLRDIRQRSIQAIGAGLSRRDWNATETAYNEARDQIDGLIRRLESNSH